MTLETMTPEPGWEPEDHREAVEALSSLGEAYEFLVWGDDGCVDCQEQLPGFAAALAAAGIDDERVTQFAVERLPEGRKRGPKVEAYGVERIPTIVVERDGEEVARYVEEADVPAAEYLARELEEVGASA